jgi:cell division GTPase FtsZ
LRGNSLEASGGRILFVGVGTSGCRIVNLLQGRGVQAAYFFASLDEEDLAGTDGVNMNGWDDEEIESVVSGAIAGRNVAFVVAGLGGSSGSNLAPRLAKAVTVAGAKTFGVTLLPFRYQKWMEYRAGVGLAKMKNHCGGLLVIDREQFVEETLEELPLNRLYEMIDSRVADALEALFVSEDGRAPAVEIRKLLKMMEKGKASLEIRDLAGGFDEGMASLVRRAYATGQDQVDEVMIYSSGNRPITFEQAKFSAEGLKNLLGNEMRLHYGSKVSERGSSVIAMVMVMKQETQLRIYDPVAQVLGGRSLDDEPEQGLAIDLGISTLD